MHSSLVVALVGPPNAGKTTIYNWLTGSRYRSVNYPGSTVEYSEGVTLERYGPSLRVLDTPGIRSLTPHSFEEVVTLETLEKERNAGHRVSVVVPVDVTQMSRHLLLVKQLQAAGYPVVVALTMVDLFKGRGYRVDEKRLSQELGCPVAIVDGLLGGGVKELYQLLADGRDQQNQQMASKSGSSKSLQWSDEEIQKTYHDLDQIISRVVRGESAKSLVKADPRTLRIDRWLMHPLWGFLFFFVVMSTLFTMIFVMAQPLIDFLDGLFSGWAEEVAIMAPDSLVVQFVSSGVIAGVGSVVVFIPQIVLLFFGISLLEDTGYLARAAALVDRPLSLIGLNGRSFVPLLSGYACAIPAMMAARTISSLRERWITIFVIPLMSCSARLPVYALLLSFLFLKGYPLWVSGVAMAGLYFLSAFMGALAAGIMSRIWKGKEPSWFLMELPTYRRPRLRTALRITFDRSISYVKRAGLTILVVSIALWILTTFPNYRESDEGMRLQQSYAGQVGRVLDPLMAPMGGDWRVGIGLLSAFAAREVFVSSLAVIFHVTDDGGGDDTLQESLISAMTEAKLSNGQPLFTISSVAGLLIFFLVALQCLPTVVMSSGEAGKGWFGLLQLVVFNASAYLLATIVVQGLRLFGVP